MTRHRMDENKVDGGIVPGPLFFEEAGILREGRLERPVVANSCKIHGKRMVASLVEHKMVLDQVQTQPSSPNKQ